MSNRIALEISDKTGWLVIQREERRNALDNEAILEFLAALEAVRKSTIVALCIAGSGEKAFCAGSDLKALATYSPDEAEYHTRLFQTLTETLDELPCATVAAINGACLGGGLEIALACDLRLASPQARFGFPELGAGALPTGGGTIRAPRAIGLARTREMMLWGEALDSETALRYGLISEICAKPPREVAQERATKLAGRVNRESVKLIKALLVSGADAPARAAQMMAYLADVALVRTNSFLSGSNATTSRNESK